MGIGNRKSVAEKKNSETPPKETQTVIYKNKKKVVPVIEERKLQFTRKIKTGNKI